MIRFNAYIHFILPTKISQSTLVKEGIAEKYDKSIEKLGGIEREREYTHQPIHFCTIRQNIFTLNRSRRDNERLSHQYQYDIYRSYKMWPIPIYILHIWIETNFILCLLILPCRYYPKIFLSKDAKNSCPKICVCLFVYLYARYLYGQQCKRRLP